MPAVQLTTHVKNSTLYSHTVIRSYSCTSKFFWLEGLLLFCIIMGLCSASSTIILSGMKPQVILNQSWIGYLQPEGKWLFQCCLSNPVKLI